MQKIATCCYCGTRAILRLDDRRHELCCSNCGAPLHDMKVMPMPKGAQSPNAPKKKKSKAEFRSAPVASHGKPSKKHRRPKKRKSFGRKMLEELWDVVEDVFD